MEKVKVLIVGAGPAGSTCGLLLKKRNIDCLLIDRAVFPRDKICGGGLTPRSCQLLNSLLPTFHYDYNSVNRLKLLVEGKQVFDLHMNQELRIVKRREFDAQLLQEYQNSGGAFANDALDTIEENDGHIIVTLKSGRQVACDYLVGADGANSRVRKHLNPQSDHGFLWMEQYGPKSPDNAIVINSFSKYLVQILEQNSSVSEVIMHLSSAQDDYDFSANLLKYLTITVEEEKRSFIQSTLPYYKKVKDNTFNIYCSFFRNTI